MFKVNNKDTRTMLMTFWCFYIGVLEQIAQFGPLFPQLILNKQKPAGMKVFFIFLFPVFNQFVT